MELKPLIIIGVAVAAAVGIVYAVGVDTLSERVENSLLASLLSGYGSTNWDEVHERYIVKSFIPVNLMERNGGTCTVSAERFQPIIEHSYFAQGERLAADLRFDNDTETIMLPCDQLHGDKSALNVWYVTPDSPVHAERYQYFLTEWDNDS
ncbi:hypothetical protein CENSYa_0264 [Cenarchaeum symbiosum A]|uniref:Uncharacterized protein n=1 Tax=Cenarchaeum symbiosum (strain A) TaxID=414004 RepID=A0RU89_CENSY|nr:hypothetical protein CENSYa_0264 [Cenarchaeum symbiosum A]